MSVARVVLSCLLAAALFMAFVVPAGSAFATGASASIAGLQVSRVSSSGKIHVTGEATAIDIQVGAGYPVCGYFPDANCSGWVEGRRVSNGASVVVGTLGSFSSSTSSPVTKQIDLTASLPNVDAIRVVVNGSNGQVASSWYPVVDPLTPASVQINSITVARDPVTGNLNLDAAVAANSFQVPGSGVCSFHPDISCVLSVEGKRSATGEVRYLGYVSGVSGASYPFEHDFDLSVDEAKISDVRFRLAGSSGDVTTPWTPISDPFAPMVGVTFNELYRNPSSGVVTYDVALTGSQYLEPLETCGSPTSFCYGEVEARRSNGSIIYLGASNNFSHDDYPSTRSYSGTTTSSLPIVEVRGVLHGANAELSTPWIPISPEGVRQGHDVGAASALALAATAGMTATEGCLTLFRVAPPVPGSSLNQAQAACFTATQGGMSFSAYLASRLAVMSSAEINMLLASAGLAVSAATAAVSPNLDYGLTLPSGCVFVGPVSISCFSGGSTTTYRPISAPPVLDPVYENNFINKANTNPAPDSPNTQTLPYIWVAPTGKEVWREALRTCVAKLSEPAGGGQTIGQLIGEEDCDGENIFFSGKDVLQATVHDIAAISAAPALTRLTYLSVSEKEALGIHRLPAKTNPACPAQQPGMHCDEYPYFATAEGYGGPAALAPPSFLSIPEGDNLSQGGRFGSFAANCPSLKNPSSPDRSFIVIPTTVLPVTFGFCGR